MPISTIASPLGMAPAAAGASATPTRASRPPLPVPVRRVQQPRREARRTFARMSQEGRFPAQPVPAAPVQMPVSAAAPSAVLQGPDHVFVNGMLTDEVGARQAAEVLEGAQQAHGIPGAVEVIADPTLKLGDPFKYWYYRAQGQTPATRAITRRIEQAVETGRPVVFHTHSQGNAAYDVGRNTAVDNLAKKNMERSKHHPAVTEPRGLFGPSPEARLKALSRAAAEQQVAGVTHHLASGSSMTPNPRFPADLISPEAPGPSPLEAVGLVLAGVDPSSEQVKGKTFHVSDPVPALTTNNVSQGNVAYHAIPSNGGFGIQNHAYNELYAPEDAKVTAEVIKRRGWDKPQVETAAAAPPIASHVFVNGMLTDEEGARQAAEILAGEQRARGIPGDVEVIADPTLGPGDPAKYWYYRAGGQTPASQAISDRIEQAVEKGEPVVFHTHSQGNAAYNVGRNVAVDRLTAKYTPQFADDPSVVAERRARRSARADQLQRSLARELAEKKVAEHTHHLASGSSMTPNPKYPADLISPEIPGPSPIQSIGLALAGIDPGSEHVNSKTSHVTDPVPALTTDNVAQGEVRYHPIPSDGGFGIQNHAFNEVYAPEDARVTAEVLERRGWALDKK